jgi:ribosomal protein S18 acetylase RimI-like enzyme
MEFRLVEITGMQSGRSPRELGRADVRRCGTFWAAPVDDTGFAWPETPGARIRLVRADDVAALRRAMIAADADRPELAEARIRGNRLGVLAEAIGDVADQPAHDRGVLAYGWVVRPGDTINDLVDDLGFPLRLPPGEAWIYDCATVPAARGRGLYTALLLVMRAELPHYGLARAWIGTAPQNWASQRGIARAGFRKVVDVDWNGQIVLYGAPGVPESTLHTIAAAMGVGDVVRILPGAGIPWIEAVLLASSVDAVNEPEGLRRFRAAYGEQLHWTARALPIDNTPDTRPQPAMAGHAAGVIPPSAGARSTVDMAVVLRVEGCERMVVGAAPYAEYERALAELAPGLPVLNP